MLRTFLAMLMFAALYWFPIRRWMNHWGATPPDLMRVMAGDSLLARILPEFQHLAVGDVIPLGRGPSWPVSVIEPNRALVLDRGIWVALIECGSFFVAPVHAAGR